MFDIILGYQEVVPLFYTVEKGSYGVDLRSCLVCMIRFIYLVNLSIKVVHRVVTTPGAVLGRNTIRTCRSYSIWANSYLIYRT